MMIVHAGVCDAASAAALAVQMWKSSTEEELTAEFESMISREDAAVFLALEEDRAVGFAQCQLRRDYVEGTSSSPVGYLEGIFVEEAFRQQWIAAALLSACEQWAKELGCTEFASDCEIENDESLAFHLKMGFCEANRIICFTKAL